MAATPKPVRKAGKIVSSAKRDMSKMKKSGVSFAERTAKTEKKLSKIPKKLQKTQVF